MLQSLKNPFDAGGLFWSGLWATRQTRPTEYLTYPDRMRSEEPAPDLAAVFIDSNLQGITGVLMPQLTAPDSAQRSSVRWPSCQGTQQR